MIYRYGNAIAKRIRTTPTRFALKARGWTHVSREFNLNGIRFLFTINVKDQGLSQQLLHNDWREYNSTKYFIEMFLGQSEVVYDVGANLGYFAMIEAAASPKNRVIAIEPVPENFKVLDINRALNGFANVETHRLAISNVDGEAEMLVCDHLNWATFNLEAEDNLRKYSTNVLRVRVPMRSLQSFQAEHDLPPPTLLRMDVEGFEYEILLGNLPYLTKHRPKLFVEFHTNLLGKEKSIEVLRGLAEAGYELDRQITNLEYCAHELVFPAPRGRGISRQLSISDYIQELSSKSDEEIRSSEGCEIFVRSRT